MTAAITFFATVGLLIWSLRQVQRGLMGAYGHALRGWAKRAENARLSAFLSGTLIAAVLQSGTATALIASKFVTDRLLSSTAALALILGADVGTAGAVFVASSIDSQLFQNSLILVGVSLTLSSRQSRLRNVGKALTGLGLLLLALATLKNLTGDALDDSSVAELLRIAQNFPFLIVVLSGLASYLAHSSLAIILVVAQLQTSGAVGDLSALAMVIGANVGGTFLPLTANMKADNDTLAPLVANIGLRGLGGLGLWLGGSAFLDNPFLSSTSIFWVPTLHLVLNFGVAVIGLVALRPILRAAQSGLKHRRKTPSETEISHLDRSVLDQPNQALACAKREALRMADRVQTSLLRIGLLLDAPNTDGVQFVEHLESDIDRLYVRTKQYLADLTRSSLSEEQTAKTFELLNFIASMEHIGDVIETNLLDVIRQQVSSGQAFSTAGAAEIQELHDLTSENMMLSLNAFLTEDDELAFQLVEKKPVIRAFVKNSSDAHLARLALGAPDTIATSAMHIDVLRDLKLINTHLMTTAYPLLSAAGHVHKSKWKRSK